LFAALGRAGVARAQDAGGDREPIHVQVDGSAGCLSEAQFFERVEARTSRVRRADAGESGRTFVVSVKPEAGGFVGSLVVVEPSGPTEPRVVHTSLCDQASSALAFIAAVSIDSLAKTATVTVPPVEPPAPGVPAAPAATAPAARVLGVEVGARAGVGAIYSGSPNPLGFGLGGRAGVVVFDHLYVGGNLMYSFGTESAHTWMYGGEAGWGFRPRGNVTIRPHVGLGNASFGYSNVPSPDATSNKLYVEPGVTVLVALGTLFVGADVNVLVVPGLGDPGEGSAFFITIHGQVGVKF
jgi:hypothetical protein